MGPDGTADLIVIAIIIFIITVVVVRKFAPEIWHDRNVYAFIKVYIAIFAAILITILIPGSVLFVFLCIGAIRFLGP